MKETHGKPIIYEENKVKVLSRLREGDVEYMDLSRWSYQDRFFAFLLGTRFFELCGASYPSPRKKEEVPVWFLLCCGVQMRMHTTAAYDRLPGLLKSGPILSRVKFNVGGMEGGFNNKNRKKRDTPVDSDGVRKFFKDTPPGSLRQWYNGDVVKFLRHNRSFDKHGIFILDQTHVVVPDNPRYKGAARMQVDENGQRLDLSHLSDEQRKAVPLRLCYGLSELIHVGTSEQSFLVGGYQWGPGNTDELVQGRVLLKDFTNSVGTDVIKLLICDKGYLDGAFITMVKQEAKADILIPLRSDMDMYKEAVMAVASPQWKGKWKPWKMYEKNGIRYIEEVACVENTGIWDTCRVTLYLSVMRTTIINGGVSYWVLASTFKPNQPGEAFAYYEKRTQIEERHRQLKHFWHIGAFTSPHESLVEAHVMFTLLTYSLVQLHLVKQHLADLTNKTIDTLKEETNAGQNAVIVYHNRYFAVFDLDEYTYIIADLSPQANERLKKWIEGNKQMSKPPSG